MPDLDTCLLNLLSADSIPSFSPTVTCVKIFLNNDYSNTLTDILKIKTTTKGLMGDLV